MKCKVNHKTGEYECRKGQRIVAQGKCFIAQKSEGGGISVFGNGGNANWSRSRIDCNDVNDIRSALNKKYPNERIEVE